MKKSTKVISITKLLLALSLSCLLFSIKAEAQTADSLVINLQTALDIALSENPTIKVADMEITKKEYGKKMAYGALMPQMDIIGSYQRAIKRQTVYFDEGLGFGGDDIDPSQYTPEELQIMKVLGDMFSMG